MHEPKLFWNLKSCSFRNVYTLWSVVRRISLLLIWKLYTFLLQPVYSAIAPIWFVNKYLPQVAVQILNLLNICCSDELMFWSPCYSLLVTADVLKKNVVVLITTHVRHVIEGDYMITWQERIENIHEFESKFLRLMDMYIK